MLHIMGLNPIPFSMIADGKKTIELRLNDEKRRLIKKEDEIQFFNTGDKTKILKCRVKQLYYFSTFEELYKELPLLKCGYTEDDISIAKASDMEEYYSQEKQDEFGVVGIELYNN